MIRHLGYEEAVNQARERQGNREISDSAALALCAAWHSPGTTGRYLAAVSTGAWSPESLRGEIADDEDPETNGALFRTDLYNTFRDTARGGADGAPANEAMIIWSALGTWSMNGGDNDEI